MRNRKNSILRAFGPESERLRPHMSDVTLSAGEVLVEPGDKVRFVHFLHHGAVSKMTVFADGSEIESALVGREGAVGAASVLGLSRSVTRDVCLVEARASRVATARLREACRRSPRMMEAIERYLVWKTTSAIRCGACNARHSVRQRSCRWILTCSDILETREITLSQDTLAKILGAQRTSLSPILQDLKLAGVLSIGRSRITVRDRAALIERSCECYAAMKEDYDLLVDAHCRAA